MKFGIPQESVVSFRTNAYPSSKTIVKTVINIELCSKKLAICNDELSFTSYFIPVNIKSYMSIIGKCNLILFSDNIVNMKNAEVHIELLNFFSYADYTNIIKINNSVVLHDDLPKKEIIF